MEERICVKRVGREGNKGGIKINENYKKGEAGGKVEREEGNGGNKGRRRPRELEKDFKGKKYYIEISKYAQTPNEK